MTIDLGPDLEATLDDLARRRGVTPEVVALDALRERFLASATTIEPRDEWERGILEAATDCGVSLPDWAVSSDGIYD